MILIIAGVTISTIMNDEGIFVRTSYAEKQYKTGQMLETVKFAQTYLYMDNIIDGTEINISNLVEKVKEISDINDENSKITVNEEEQTARIVDKKTGATVDITTDNAINASDVETPSETHIHNEDCYSKNLCSFKYLDGWSSDGYWVWRFRCENCGYTTGYLWRWL